MQARVLRTKHRDTGHGSCLARDDSQPEPCLAPMDGVGISGLKLFCSLKSSSVQAHKDTEKVLQFSGTVGDWGKKLTCEEEHWVSAVEVRYAIDLPTENLGIVQMRLKCKHKESGAETSEGKIFPFGHPTERGVSVSPTSGPLETLSPQLYERRVNSQSDLHPWEPAITADPALPSSGAFVRGIRVKTDQDNDVDLPDDYEVNSDMVGIDDVQFATKPYGESNISCWMQ